MSKKAIVFFVAELTAIAVLRVLYMVRRDRQFLPKGSKVNYIKNKPVFKGQTLQSEPEKPEKPMLVEEQGWTPEYIDGKIQNTPDNSLDAKPSRP